MAPRDVQTLTEARALSAMAHPLRARILDALTVDGPSTASVLAERLDQAVGNASHHLKILGQAQLIEEAPELARDRRERWWRLTSSATRWSTSEFADDPAAVSAALAAERLHLTRQYDRARVWLDAGEPNDEWADAAFAMQRWLRLTPGELRQVTTELLEVLDRWATRDLDSSDAERPQRQPVLVFARGFPAEP